MGVTILTPTSAPVQVRARSRVAAVPWHIYAVLFAATSMVVGVIWDISWHMTIGRDTFWTPAHLAIYLGGVVGGASNGVVVLRTTFRGTPDEKARGVRFWGFRGPLGAWVSIWGAIAMITSAPFDDWWHNAYGLDVEILSPPHTILALGMFGIALGAMLSVLALQNRARDDAEGKHLAGLVAIASGMLLTMIAIMVYEYSERVIMHTSLFYRVLCGVFPFVLLVAARASRVRFGATAAAAVYTAVTAGMLWILPLFPASPKLGPIYQNVTHMVPMNFPLLLVVPALAVDAVLQLGEGERRNDWLIAVAAGFAFFVTFLAVQWSFAYFLMSGASMNWFFATDSYPYFLPSTSSTVRRVFVPLDANDWAMRRGLLAAALLAVAASRAGLALGGWMRGVRR